MKLKLIYINIVLASIVMILSANYVYASLNPNNALSLYSILGDNFKFNSLYNPVKNDYILDYYSMNYYSNPISINPYNYQIYKMFIPPGISNLNLVLLIQSLIPYTPNDYDIIIYTKVNSLPTILDKDQYIIISDKTFSVPFYSSDNFWSGESEKINRYDIENITLGYSTLEKIGNIPFETKYPNGVWIFMEIFAKTQTSMVISQTLSFTNQNGKKLYLDWYKKMGDGDITNGEWDYYGNPPFFIVDATPPVIEDNKSPALSSTETPEVKGNQLVLTYDEKLDVNKKPDAKAFTVVGTSTPTTVAKVEINDNKVVLTLDNPVTYSDTDIKVSYDNKDNPIQDLAGNRAALFNNKVVANKTPQVIITEPVLKTAEITVDKLILTFDKDFSAAEPPPSINDFTITVNGGKVETPFKEQTPSMSGNTVTLTLNTAVFNEDNLTVKYKDAAEIPITNNTPPMFDNATVSGNILVINYKGKLNTEKIPDIKKSEVFKVIVGDKENKVKSVEVKETKVNLTLTDKVSSSAVVTLSYIPPEENAIQDPNGNKADNLDKKSVQTPPGFVSAAVNEKELVLTYDEPLKSDIELNTGNFKVTVGENNNIIITESNINNNQIKLTLDTKILNSDVVIVNYTGDTIQDINGNKADSFKIDSSDDSSNFKNNTPKPLSILPADLSEMIAGGKAEAFKVDGGTLPYNVTIQQETSNITVVTTSLDNAANIVTVTPKAAGNATITITDANGKTAKIEVTVVLPKELPSDQKTINLNTDVNDQETFNKNTYFKIGNIKIATNEANKKEFVLSDNSFGLSVDFPAYDGVVDIWIAITTPDNLSLMVGSEVDSDGKVIYKFVDFSSKVYPVYKKGVDKRRISETIVKPFDPCNVKADDPSFSKLMAELFNGTWTVYWLIAPSSSITNEEPDIDEAIKGNYEFSYYSFEVECK